ncbi:MAG: hypothetical protein WCW03_00180 [Candidatus Paceibacterota bacterium]|jgi:hypothetical protein
MDNKEQYLSLISEIIAKQAVILGPEIAILKARNVQGLKVEDDGKVTDMQGDYKEIIEKLVDEYVALSGQIVRSALTSVFTKYPNITKV